MTIKIDKNKLKDLTKKYLMPAVATASCLFTFLYVKNDMENKPVMELYYCGEKVGFVDNKEVCSDAVGDAQLLLSQRHEVGYKFPADCLTFKVGRNGSNKLLTKDGLVDILVKDADKNFTDACGLYIDGTLVTIGENESKVQGVLDRAMELYSELYKKVKTEEDIVLFNSRFNMETISVPLNSVKSVDEMESILGIDNLENLNLLFLEDSSLSEKITVEDISDAVPELSEITYADLSFDLPSENVYYSPDYNAENKKEHTASVSFRSSAVEVSTEVLDCGEEIIYDNTLPEGKIVLLKSGVYGIKESTYNVDYIDGVEVTRTLITETIVKKPIPKKYKVGTKSKAKSSSGYSQKVVSSNASSGQFMFPTNGTITSTFKGRNLFGQYEFHGAIDIANKTGTAIYAADGGTVTYASPFDTYGNCIIINHGNGLETLYAHLNSYNVKVGDVVTKGQQVAEMGATGRVTGPHLHFEVRVNGQRVDPLNYVSQ